MRYEVKPFTRVCMNSCKILSTYGVFYNKELIHTYDDIDMANYLKSLCEKHNICSYKDLCEYQQKLDEE